jgi:hypothetical protein
MTSWRSEILESRNCEYCGKLYAPRQKNQRCCSTVCTHALWQDIRREGVKLVQERLLINRHKEFDEAPPVFTRKL